MAQRDMVGETGRNTAAREEREAAERGARETKTGRVKLGGTGRGAAAREEGKEADRGSRRSRKK